MMATCSVFWARERLRRKAQAAEALSWTILVGAAMGAGLFGIREVRSDETVASPMMRALPDYAIAVLHVPDGAAFADALVANTQLGRLLDRPERKTAFYELLFEEASFFGTDSLEDGASYDESADLDDAESHRRDEDAEPPLRVFLEKYGVSVEDVEALCRGELGYALLVDGAQNQDDEPLGVVGVGWASPGEQSVDRIYEAIGRAVEELEDRDPPVRRTDIQVADHEIMQLQIPSEVVHYAEDFVLPDDYGDLSDEEQRQVYKSAYDSYLASGATTTNWNVLLVCRSGGQIMFTHSFGSSEEDSLAELSERLTAHLARILAADAAQDEQAIGEFMTRFADSPGMEPLNTQPGVAAVELWADMTTLFRVAKSHPGFAGGPDGNKLLRMVGAERLGLVGFRLTLDEQRLVQRLFIEAAAPRRGLLRLLDQQALSIEPPAWAPASAVGYSQYSFDAALAYQVIREEVLKEYDEIARQPLQMFETQFQAMAQVGLEELLRSLGNRHVGIAYAPELRRSADAQPDAQYDQFADEDEAAASEMIALPIERGAVVWEVADEGLWSRLMTAVGPMATMAAGAKATDEQGYRGWRIDGSQYEGGVVIGKGRLVVGYGRNALEATLSSLNNPPQGADSLRGGDLFRRGAELVELRPAISIEMVDADQYIALGRKTLADWISEERGLSSMELDEGSRARLAAIAEKLIPDPQEAADLAGVAVTLWEVDDHGVTGLSVTELPAP